MYSTVEMIVPEKDFISVLPVEHIIALDGSKEHIRIHRRAKGGLRKAYIRVPDL
jgi:hypothetical protein